jgi:F420-non-reducing hydrogenase iron-sulfur subunit
MKMSFEPEILAFCCNWCSYAGADLAGVSRYQYPPNVRIIRVMCSGRVDPEFILHAFQKGIDGVMVIGCHIGDCHYVSGNLEAEKKVKMVKKFLEIVGFESDRLALEWVSAAEGLRFSRLITDFVEKVRRLGPNPMRKKKEKLELKR